MKIKSLIKHLEELYKIHGNISVILQSDQEGNYYHEVRGAEACYTDDDLEINYSSEEDVIEDEFDPEDFIQRIVIYP
jgi:hypothetical protein